MLILNPFQPGGWSLKPKRHLTELNPQGQLTPGLVLCTLWESNYSTTDYVQTGLSYTYSTSPAPAVTTCGLGGGQISSNSALTSIVNSPVIALSAWTYSVMTLFIGANWPGTRSLWLSDGSGDYGFFVEGLAGATPGAFGLNTGGAGTTIGSWRAANYTGWHRITVTATAQTGTGSFYFDGALIGTGTITVGTPQIQGVLGDTVNMGNTNQPTSDSFAWNYCLSAAQVAAHADNPYGTTLRPKYGKLGLVGYHPMGTACPALLTLGVGP